MAELTSSRMRCVWVHEPVFGRPTSRPLVFALPCRGTLSKGVASKGDRDGNFNCGFFPGADWVVRDSGVPEEKVHPIPRAGACQRRVRFQA